jgi:hypothetical protein
LRATSTHLQQSSRVSSRALAQVRKSRHPTTQISTTFLTLLPAPNITSYSPLTLHSSPPTDRSSTLFHTHPRQPHLTMVVDWKDKSVQDRLLTAVIASVDNKVRPHPYLPSRTLLTQLLQISPAEIARLYGPDMTYYAVENYLRKFRRDAKGMKKEAGDRDVPAPSPRRRAPSRVVSCAKGWSLGYWC